MEYLYEIPEDASLSYTLSEENKGQMVWDINISMNVYSNEFYYNQGYVKIDAKTGDIISLNRIAKIKANYGYMSSTPYPYVSPSSTYIPEPYISPGITPFTSSSPTTAP